MFVKIIKGSTSDTPKFVTTAQQMIKGDRLDNLHVLRYKMFPG
jgi:hypothetical protein